MASASPNVFYTDSESESDDTKKVNDFVAKVTNAVFHHAMRWTFPITADVKNHQLYIDETKVFLGKNSDNWIFQHEKGASGADHVQAYLHTKLKVRSSQLADSLKSHMSAKFGSQLAPMYWCRPASDVGKDALKKYCMKADTRVAGPYASKRIYTGADLPTQLYPWQQTVVTAITEECKNNRRILWIYDPVGNQGKSVLGKLCAFKYKMPMFTFAKAADMLYLVSQNQNCNAYLFDLSRSKPAAVDMADIYHALEQIKCGYIQSTKYKPETILQDPAHVVVFANFKPEAGKLSDDRWVVYELSNNELHLMNKKRRLNPAGAAAAAAGAGADSESTDD